MLAGTSQRKSSAVNRNSRKAVLFGFPSQEINDPSNPMHYLIVIPHKPLNPRMIFKADPAMKAPCVARIPLKNLCNM